MKILIIKPSALGDVVQTLPVLTGLKRHWPDATIDWVISERWADLVTGHECLNEVILYPRERWTSPWHLGEIRRWARNLRSRHYDLVLDLQGLLRSGLMTWCTGSPRRIGLQSAREGARFAYNEVVHDNPPHAADRYLMALRYLGIPRHAYDFRIPVHAPVPPPLKNWGSYLVLHPYSRWRTKLWPWRFYQELITGLGDLNFVVVGEGPWFPLPQINRVIDLRGKLKLGTLVRVLSEAEAVLSTDSGPAHISAALGRPTLTLFGATDPQKTRPVGPHVLVHKRDVFCSPCLKKECFRDTPMECMTQISPLEVGVLLNSLLLHHRSSRE